MGVRLPVVSAKFLQLTRYQYFLRARPLLPSSQVQCRASCHSNCLASRGVVYVIYTILHPIHTGYHLDGRIARVPKWSAWRAGHLKEISPTRVQQLSIWIGIQATFNRWIGTGKISSQIRNSSWQVVGYCQ